MKKRFDPKTFAKWLYPGMGIKRWFSMALFGVVLILTSAFGMTRCPESGISGIITGVYYTGLILGIVLIILAFKNIMVSIVTLLLPHKEGPLIDIMYEKRFLEHGPKIVVVGGGTGLSVLLHGIKEHTSNITAIVTVADDGGSSGRLRQQFDIVSPGDIRNCLVALANEETMMRELFQYRFKQDTEFSGHSFGNLFITAMTQVTGDFEKAVRESSKVLSIRGRVVPSTLEKLTLVAQHKDGRVTEGEAQIPKTGSPINKIFIRPQGASAAPDAIKAIKEAELIILGPGSLYTSIIPNLLIREICDAITASTVSKIYVCNIMTQAGETENFKASDHVKALVAHTNSKILDTCIMNAGQIPSAMLEKYALENSIPVEADSSAIKALGYNVVEEDFVSVPDYVRHDAGKLANIIANLLDLKKHGNQKQV